MNTLSLYWPLFLILGSAVALFMYIHVSYKREMAFIDKRHYALMDALDSNDHAQLDQWLKTYGVGTEAYLLSLVIGVRNDFYALQHP